VIDPAPQRRRFVQSLAPLRKGADADRTHRLRTSASRLKTWLELADERALIDDLSWVRDRAADVRGIDVALRRDPPPALRTWLASERERKHASMALALERPRVAALVEALGRLEPIRTRDAKERLPAFVDRVRRRGARLTQDASATRFHRVRRALRRLRNAREWLGLDVDELGEALDAFGTLNDTTATLSLARRCPARKELEPFRRELRMERQTERSRVLEVWKRLEL
jgi:CHAD domain-containing protein